MRIPGLYDLSNIERAILQTVAYADIFHYPLTSEEIHRYLAKFKASLDEVQAVLDMGCLEPVFLNRYDGFYALPGRSEVVGIRQRRAEQASFLWPRAMRYGRMIARLPFVRMVAITGSLAMDNEEGRDMDYLIVTEPGRLWLCRGLVILLVRWAMRYGDIICPNYFLSERALVFPDQNLYTAHELFQMTPVFGMDTYWKIRQLNSWAVDFLPNASGLPRKSLETHSPKEGVGLRTAAEAALRTPLGGWVERWEMNRKLRKFNRMLQPDSEANFSPDWCKGHFGSYRERTLATYQERLQAFETGQFIPVENER